MAPKPQDDHDLEGWARRYAPRLNRRSWRWPLARPSYEGMSGALVWPDEPLWFAPTPVTWALRPLWWYRTWFALPDRYRNDLDDEEYRQWGPYWELCRGLFPMWVGFHPDRFRWGRREVILYRTGHIACIRCLRELDAEAFSEEDSPATAPGDGPVSS